MKRQFIAVVVATLAASVSADDVYHGWASGNPELYPNSIVDQQRSGPGVGLSSQTPSYKHPDEVYGSFVGSSPGYVGTQPGVGDSSRGWRTDGTDTRGQRAYQAPQPRYKHPDEVYAQSDT